MEMKIKITEKNNEKLESVLAKANGQCRERLVDKFDLYKFVNRVERHLNRLGIPKKYWVGTQASYCECIKSKSYKYRATATKVTITRGSSAWFLVLARRENTGVGKAFKSETMKAGSLALTWYQNNVERIVNAI